MYEKLKIEIKEIIDIANMCPDEYREKCFDILLTDYLKDGRKSDEFNTMLDTNNDIQEESDEESDIASEDEIEEKDIHIKTRKFLQQHKITIKQINMLYYKEGDEILPLYDTLGCTTMSECQIRLMLLTAFENSLFNGEMYFEGETVRQRCQEMKCYDTPNFTKILKNNADLIDNWDEKYDKSVKYRLSLKGKNQLAEVINNLTEEG